MVKKRNKEGESKLTHDTFFDETFGMPEFGIAFLKKVLPRKITKQLELEKLTVQKPKFRDVLFRETRPDVVYKVPICGIDDYVSIRVIVEHKSSDDHSAIFQLWGYVCQQCVQDAKERLTDPETKQRKAWPKGFRLSPVIPIILHHGNFPFSGETQLADLFYQIPGVREYLPHLKAILFDLSAIEEGNLPRDPKAPELHVVLLMMKVIFSKVPKTLKNKFNEILDELQPYSQMPKYRELIRKLWHYVVYNAENMTESDFSELENAVRKTIGDNKMPTMAQIFIEKGEAKGKIEGRIEAILESLEDRLGEVPQATRDAVAKITDLTVLRQLAVLARKCKSLAEFKKALK